MLDPFEIELFYTGKVANLYTIRHLNDNNNESLINQFIQRFKPTKHQQALDTIIAFVKQAIADKHGVLDVLIHPQGLVQAVPPPPEKVRPLYIYLQPQFPLRLFVLKLSEQVLTLFDGGVKDAQKLQESACSIQWLDAQKKTKIIDKAIRNGELLRNGKYLEDPFAEQIILL